MVWCMWCSSGSGIVLWCSSSSGGIVLWYSGGGGHGAVVEMLCQW